MANAANAILAVDASPFGRGLSVLPALRALRTAYPQTYIAAAVSRGVTELVTAGGLMDETLDLGFIGTAGSGLAGSVTRLTRLVKGARRSRFDLILDFSPHVESHLAWRLLAGRRAIMPSRLSFAIEGLLDIGGGQRPTHQAEIDSVLRQIGIGAVETRFAVTVPDEEHDRFEELLRKSGSRGGEPLVVMYASCTGGERAWAVENYADVADRLAKNLSARIIVVDEPFGRNFTGAIKSFLPKGAIQLSQPRAFEALAAMARASLVLSDDAGIARLSAELGTRALELADTPAAAVSPDHRVIASSSLARLSADAVFDAACAMIQKSRTETLFRM